MKYWISGSLSFTWNVENTNCFCKDSVPTTFGKVNYAISGIYNCFSNETNVTVPKHEGFHCNNLFFFALLLLFVWLVLPVITYNLQYIIISYVIIIFLILSLPFLDNTMLDRQIKFIAKIHASDCTERVYKLIIILTVQV